MHAIHQSGSFRTEDGQDQFLRPGDPWHAITLALENTQLLPEQHELKMSLIMVMWIFRSFDAPHGGVCWWYNTNIHMGTQACCLARTLLPPVTRLAISHIDIADQQITITATTTAATAACPMCEVASTRMHSCLDSVLRLVGLALGGEAGARLVALLVACLGMTTSPDTLLRLFAARRRRATDTAGRRH